MASLEESITNMKDRILQGSPTAYKPVSVEQIDDLERNGNFSSDWSKVLMIESADASTLSRIRRCSFEGAVFISLLTGNISKIDGVAMPSGLYDSFFAGTCFLSDSCRVSSTAIVSNVYLGRCAGIVNCGSITCQEFNQSSTAFLSNTLQIDVGPETGGRSVTVSVDMNFLEICRQLFSPDKGAGINLKCQSRYSIVGDRSLVMGCDRVHNCLLGPGCKVTSSSLDACILSSTPSSPISVSGGANLAHCIMNEACSACNNCLAEYVYMSEYSSIGDCARVAHCVLGPDSSVAGGECHHSLLGPFVGFHHQSLLIAAVWPQGRGNIAYGAKVGANHTGRVSDQECWPGEGIFFGLGSAVKFPSNLVESPYSIVASGVVLPPQKICYPFSLISTSDRCMEIDEEKMYREKNVLRTVITISPGWVIRYNPYMIDRASTKFSGRRKARLHRTDYPILRPYIVDMVLSARNALYEDDHFYQNEGSQNYSGLGSCVLTLSTLHQGIEAYTSLLRRYALHGLLYLILWFSSHEAEEATQLKVNILQSIEAEVTPKGSTSQSSWGALEKDLNVFALPMDSLERSDLVVTDSHFADVHTHQLRILQIECPSFDLRAALMGFPDAGTTVPGERAVMLGGALPLLRELCAIESAHAAAVLACRSRDGAKGRLVIPDYDAVNGAGADVMSDPVVCGSLERAKQMAHTISELFGAA